jgi:hypothetical protein
MLVVAVAVNLYQMVEQAAVVLVVVQVLEQQEQQILVEVVVEVASVLVIRVLQVVLAS